MDLEKKLWMKSLQVGDEVCDCGSQHKKIVEIIDIWKIRFPRFLRSIIWAFWMPKTIKEFFRKISHYSDKPKVNWFNKFFLEQFLLDRELVFEDGNSCSAIYCCRPIFAKSHR